MHKHKRQILGLNAELEKDTIGNHEVILQPMAGVTVLLRKKIENQVHCKYKEARTPVE